MSNSLNLNPLPLGYSLEYGRYIKNTDNSLPPYYKNLEESILPVYKFSFFEPIDTTSSSYLTSNFHKISNCSFPEGENPKYSSEVLFDFDAYFSDVNTNYNFPDKKAHISNYEFFSALKVTLNRLQDQFPELDFQNFLKGKKIAFISSHGASLENLNQDKENELIPEEDQNHYLLSAYKGKESDDPYCNYLKGQDVYNEIDNLGVYDIVIFQTCNDHNGIIIKKEDQETSLLYFQTINGPNIELSYSYQE